MHSVQTIRIIQSVSCSLDSQTIVNPRSKISIMDGTIIAVLNHGMLVNFILNKDRTNFVPTGGIVKDILSCAPKHYRCIKVRLNDGQIGGAGN